jgi:dTDP-4-amino-4,6-dideoxygalactose transaminase
MGKELQCDLAPGDGVIMPSFTFASTANAVVLREAVPTFVDIRRDSCACRSGMP